MSFSSTGLSQARSSMETFPECGSGKEGGESSPPERGGRRRNGRCGAPYPLRPGPGNGQQKGPLCQGNGHLPFHTIFQYRRQHVIFQQEFLIFVGNNPCFRIQVQKVEILADNGLEIGIQRRNLGASQEGDLFSRWRIRPSSSASSASFKASDKAWEIRAFISLAAAFVKVSTRSSLISVWFSGSLTRRAIRSVRTAVFPLPAAAERRRFFPLTERASSCSFVQWLLMVFLLSVRP